MGRSLTDDRILVELFESALSRRIWCTETLEQKIIRTIYTAERFAAGAWQFERIFELEPGEATTDISGIVFQKSQEERKLALPRGLARHLILLVSSAKEWEHQFPELTRSIWACEIKFARKVLGDDWELFPSYQNRTLLLERHFGRLLNELATLQ